MRRNIVASVRLTSSAGVAPSRFRLWKSGPNPGDYGALNYTREAHERVMGEWMRRGNALVIDYEHAFNPRVNPKLDPADPPPTAGYLTLESVETPDGPELWCVPRWSDCGRDAPLPGQVCCGKHQITSGQRIYVSPDFDISDTREPLCLNRVALVAEPATHGINMLASASANRRKNMDEKAIRAAYALALMQSEGAEGPLKAAALAYVEQLKVAAAALGVNVDEEPAPDSEPAVQAASEETIDPADKPAPMAAKVTASKVNAMKTSSAKPLTIDDVRAEMARAQETDRLRGIVASRMPKGSENVVASMNLTQLRTAARDLPAPVAADAGTGGDTGGSNITAGKGDAGLTADERSKLNRARSALGQSGEENITAARKLLDSDPEGAIRVSLGVITAKHIANRNPAKSALRFGA